MRSTDTHRPMMGIALLNPSYGLNLRGPAHPADYPQLRVALAQKHIAQL